MEQLLSRGEGRDDEHPVEDIFPVKIIFAPMFLYPSGMLRVDDQLHRLPKASALWYKDLAETGKLTL